MANTSGSATALSPWWRHSAILVMIGGFSVLSFVTVLTYTNAPPIPEKAVDAAGDVVFTGADIQKGQEVFFKYALMEHGSLWGHGAYLGPDYSAEYLHRLSEVTRDTIAVEKYGRPFAQLSPDEQSAASAQVRKVLKENRYEPASRTLLLTPGEVAAYRSQTAEWSDYFTKKGAAPGLPASYIKNPTELKALSAFFAWAAWAASANRPGKDYSYTNNWPYEPLVGNRPSAEAYVWSALSLITLLGGLGLILFLVGKFDYLGWKGEGDIAHITHSAPTPLTLTPSQWATGLVLRRRGAPIPGAIVPGRRACPLPRGARRLLRLRHRSVPALHSGTHLAPPTRHLLDRHGLGRRRPFPGALGGWRGAQRPKSWRLRSPRCTCWWWFSAAFSESTWASTTSSGASGSGSGIRVPNTWISGGSGSSCWRLASSSGFS